MKRNKMLAVLILLVLPLLACGGKKNTVWDALKNDDWDDNPENVEDVLYSLTTWPGDLLDADPAAELETIWYRKDATYANGYLVMVRHGLLEDAETYGDTLDNRLGVCVGYSRACRIILVVTSDRNYVLGIHRKEAEKTVDKVEIGDLVRFKTFGERPEDPVQWIGHGQQSEFVVLKQDAYPLVHLVKLGVM